MSYHAKQSDAQPGGGRLAMAAVTEDRGSNTVEGGTQPAIMRAAVAPGHHREDWQEGGAGETGADRTRRAHEDTLPVPTLVRTLRQRQRQTRCPCCGAVERDSGRCGRPGRGGLRFHEPENGDAGEGPEDAQKLLNLTVAVEYTTGMIQAMVVPSQGTSETWVACRLVTFVDSFGARKTRLTSDNEPAIFALCEATSQQRAEGTQTLLEHPPNWGSNQAVEGAIGITKGIIRTTQRSLEQRLGATLGHTHRIVPWLAEHAVTMRNMCQVWKGSRTPRERMRGAR